MVEVSLHRVDHAELSGLSETLTTDGLPDDDAYRAAGHAENVLALLEQEACRMGVNRLHHLTTTAARFFRRHGYRHLERDKAPPAITGSREFTTLCPATADYLVKTL